MAMEELLARILENLVGRVDGPLKFRLLFQPAMAILFAIRDGRKDAREGRVPYFWAIFTQPLHRKELLQEGWKAVGKVFVIATVIDLIYQLIALRWLYPGEALLVAFSLACIPYLLIRGPVNRLIRQKPTNTNSPRGRAPVA
jgi:hypothetical protein